MACEVAPLLHKYPKPEGAVRVTEPPVQNDSEPPAVMAGCEGVPVTVTVTGTDWPEVQLPT